MYHRVIRRLAEAYGLDGGYPKSVHSVARRVKKSAEYADGLDAEDVYTHCLRATAATEFAYPGLSAFSLCAVMGWSDLSVAQKYVRMSGGRAADELAGDD